MVLAVGTYGEAPSLREVAGSFLIFLGWLFAVGMASNDKKGWREPRCSLDDDDEGVDEIMEGSGAGAAVGTGGTTAEIPTPSGTVRIKVRPSSAKQFGTKSRVLTVVWALLLTLVALACEGEIAWFIVGLWWKYVL